MYLDHGALNNMPISRAARKENWGYKVLAGSNIANSTKIR